METGRKIIAKLKTVFRPKGYSVISSGPGKGLLWSHEISDLRYLTGTYESDIAVYLLKKMDLGFSFIDVGANAGYYSLLAARSARNTNQKIIAAEPMEENLRLIKKHIKLNQLSQIIILPYAVSDSERELEFSASSNLAANTYNSQTSFYQNAPKIKVQSKSLDSICQNYTFDKLLIKIDVEGAEADVLRGSKKILSETKPEIILATHECHVKGVEEECLSLLQSFGYNCLKIDEQKFVEGQADYLCIPG